MKQIVISLWACLVGVSCFSQETWVVDNAHSNLRFEVGWQDFSMRTGEFKTFDGSITVTDSIQNLKDGLVSFVVDAASVDVIADRLADHIRSEKFLNTELHPEIVYTSDKLVASSDSTYVSNGLLKICGVEKEQEVSIWVKGYKETKKGNIFGIQVSLVVDRTRFGLTWGSPRMGDKITMVGHLLYKIEEEEKEK